MFKEKLKNEEKIKNSYYPIFFEEILYRVEILRSNNHVNPENYTIPKLFKLSNIVNNFRRNNIIEAHIVERMYNNVVNSSNEKDRKKATKEYNNLLERFQNGF